MPQLDPAPWFLIMVFSWLVFFTTIFPKTLKFAFANNPARQCISVPGLKAWDWAWS